MSPLGGYELAVAFLMVSTIKTTVLLSASWMAVSAVRHRSATFRHVVWAAGILGSLTLPLFTLLLPTWHTTTLGSAAGLWGPAQTIAAQPSSRTLPAMIVNAVAASPMFGEWAVLVLLVWGAGFLFVTVRLAVALARLRWLCAHSRPLSEDGWLRAAGEYSKSLQLGRPVRLLQCGDPVAMPLTWGLFRPLILLPSAAAEWPEDRRRIVLCHELAHIVRQDWFLQICAELTLGFYWFHPLAWMAAGRLRQESEHACDDFVLNSGVDPFDYARQLLDLARTLQNSSRAAYAALAIARPSNLERRFAAMLNPHTNRRRLSRVARLLTAFSALCLLLPLAALRLPAQDLSGSFTGAVSDPSGAAVQNATIIMTNPRTHGIEMTASDARGHFDFNALPAGEYEMSVLKRGFEEYRPPRVVLEAGRKTSQNVTLQLGAALEEMDVVAEGTAEALPSSQTAGKPTRMRIGGDVERAKLLTKVQPIYPAAAKAAGTEGSVILHAIVGMDGTPLSLRVMNNQVDPELARAAVEAVSKWRYRPTLLNGHPVEVDTTIMVNFSLLP
jgi:TonB family protein